MCVWILRDSSSSKSASNPARSPTCVWPSVGNVFRELPVPLELQSLHNTKEGLDVSHRGPFPQIKSFCAFDNIEMESARLQRTCMFCDLIRPRQDVEGVSTLWPNTKIFSKASKGSRDAHRNARIFASLHGVCGREAAKEQRSTNFSLPFSLLSITAHSVVNPS